MVRSISTNAPRPSHRRTTASGIREPAGVGYLEAPVRVTGRLRLVEGDDGIDQGEIVLAQARLHGRAPPHGPPRPQQELTGRGGFGEAGGGAVPVALLGAVGPADQAVGKQVAQRAPYVSVPCWSSSTSALSWRDLARRSWTSGRRTSPRISALAWAAGLSDQNAISLASRFHEVACPQADQKRRKCS